MRISDWSSDVCSSDLPSDCDPSKTFKNFSPKVGLEFQATPGTLFYASVSRGFKSGTYNFGVPAGAVDPEEITDYEIGMKSTFAGGRLRTNLSGFYYDYKDLQQIGRATSELQSLMRISYAV